MAQDNSPDLNDLFNEFKNEVFLDLNCVQIGRIEAFNHQNQTATVQLVMKHVVSVATDGTKALEERPVLLTCPVFVLTGGAARVTLPIAAGDPCLVLFCDREIDGWFATGGVQAPLTNRAHDLSDAIALVGIRSLQNALADYYADGIELAQGGNSLRLSSAATTSTAPITAPALHAVNGVSGTFNTVTVVDGIVVGGA